MKKSILAIATMAALMSGAADTESYLYWMVNVNEAGYTDVGYSATVKGVPSGGGEGTYLSLCWVDGGDAITTTKMGAPSGVSSVGREDLKTLNNSGWGFYAGLASNPTYGSYVIELWADGMGKVGEASIEAAQAAAYIAQNGIGVPATSPWTVAMTIPEPNSGLLLLLGGAVLALRRRKQEKKA